MIMLPTRSVHAATLFHTRTPPSALYQGVRKPGSKANASSLRSTLGYAPRLCTNEVYVHDVQKKRCLMGTLPASDSLCEEHLKGSNVGASAYHDQRSPRRRQRRNHENNLISSRGLYTYRNGECLTSTKHHKSLIALEGQVK